MNDAVHDGAVAARLDDQHQAQGRRRQLDRRAGVFVLRAVDNISPLDQFREVGGLKAILFGDRVGDELGAGFIGRVIELRRPGAGDEMLLVFGRQEGALVVIEPPGQARRRAVLEIDDSVFVAVEEFFFDELLIRFVGQPCEADLGGGADLLAEKAREHGGGRKTIKAMVMV